LISSDGERCKVNRYNPESVSLLCRLAQVIDYTAVRKIPIEFMDFMYGCMHLFSECRMHCIHFEVTDFRIIYRLLLDAVDVYEDNGVK